MAPERKYSLSEIDRMRDSVTVLYQFGTRRIFTLDDATAIEGRLRTYMLAGITPEELAMQASIAVEAEFRRSQPQKQGTT